MRGAISGVDGPVQYQFLAQVAGAGATIDIDGFPANTKEILIVFGSISLNGTDQILIRQRAAGVTDAVGYQSASARLANAAAVAAVNNATGWIIDTNLAADVVSGHVRMARAGDPATSTLWVCTHLLVEQVTSSIITGAGNNILSAADGIRLLPTGANNFDGGQLAVYYVA